MQLVKIREKVELRNDAAASFMRLERDKGQQQVNRTSSDYDVQLDLHEQYVRGEYPYLALHPDESEHVFKSKTGKGGIAWDTEERGAYLDEYGWLIVNNEEPWHREYRATADKHINDKAPIQTEWDDDEESSEMNIIQLNAAGTKYELKNGRKRSISSHEWAALRALQRQGLELRVVDVAKSVLDSIPGS